MPKKKNFLQVAIDNIKEALQSFSVKRAVEARDKRSIKRGKTLIKEIAKNYSDKEAAAALEISRQKYTALKGQVKKGKVASSDLNNLLEQTREKLDETSGRPQFEIGQYISDRAVEGKKKFKIDYVIASQDYVEKKLPWAQNMKPGGFASLQSALNWYGGAGSGRDYFIIAKGKRGQYFIYDIRTPSEKSKSRKGSVSGSTKASRIMEKDRIK